MNIKLSEEKLDDVLIRTVDISLLSENYYLLFKDKCMRDKIAVFHHNGNIFKCDVRSLVQSLNTDPLLSLDVDSSLFEKVRVFYSSFNETKSLKIRDEQLKIYNNL